MNIDKKRSGARQLAGHLSHLHERLAAEGDLLDAAVVNAARAFLDDYADAGDPASRQTFDGDAAAKRAAACKHAYGTDGRCQRPGCGAQRKRKPRAPALPGVA